MGKSQPCGSLQSSRGCAGVPVLWPRPGVGRTGGDQGAEPSAPTQTGAVAPGNAQESPGVQRQRKRGPAVTC